MTKFAVFEHVLIQQLKVSKHSSIGITSRTLLFKFLSFSRNYSNLKTFAFLLQLGIDRKSALFLYINYKLSRYVK